MKRIIVGTAGHIDHGKTSLVRALTGVDADRLKEEKERGITIDIGFADLTVGDVHFGFVDVPGHERFVKNMLAGAHGMDLVMLTVAADEGVMPQTREHFDICRLLEIKAGLIVLTKIDMVDAEFADLVEADVADYVAGSFLESAPIVPVSSVTGLGLDELKRALRERAVETKPKDASGWFRMPVDRAFTMRGFGTVATGTLISGSVAVEQEVELYPERRPIRIRGIQVHGAAVNKAFAGQRTALNLAGVELADVSRGMTLAAPSRFEPVRFVDARFDLLATANPLEHGSPVHFHAGTAEVEAQVRLLDPPDSIEPGATGYVRFVLKDPLLILPGDRFIVRMFSPVVTIGGGEVLDINASVRMKRADSAARLRRLDGASPVERVHVLASETKYGLGLPELIARTGLQTDELRRSADPSRFAVFEEPQFWLLDRGAAGTLARELQSAVQTFHKENPLAAGIGKEDLRARVLPESPSFLLDALLATVKGLVVEGDVVRMATHKIAFRQDEEQALAKMERAFESAGLAVPSTTEVLAKSGVESARAKTLLQMLLKNRKLVRVSDDLVFHAGAVAKLRELLAPRKGQRFSVAEFKDWTGISRKYAIPLLEFLDRERITRREGDARVVL